MPVTTLSPATLVRAALSLLLTLPLPFLSLPDALYTSWQRAGLPHTQAAACGYSLLHSLSCVEHKPPLLQLLESALTGAAGPAALTALAGTFRATAGVVTAAARVRLPGAAAPGVLPVEDVQQLLKRLLPHANEEHLQALCDVADASAPAESAGGHVSLAVLAADVPAADTLAAAVIAADVPAADTLTAAVLAAPGAAEGERAAAEPSQGAREGAEGTAADGAGAPVETHDREGAGKGIEAGFLAVLAAQCAAEQAALHRGVHEAVSALVATGAAVDREALTACLQAAPGCAGVAHSVADAAVAEAGARGLVERVLCALPPLGPPVDAAAAHEWLQGLQARGTGHGSAAELPAVV